jgi:hypothetical protein
MHKLAFSLSATIVSGGLKGVWGVNPHTEIPKLCHHNGRAAPLTSGRCILNIYSTNIRTEYFKHAA